MEAIANRIVDNHRKKEKRKIGQSKCHTVSHDK